MTKSIPHYQCSIRACYPHFEIVTAELNQGGQNSDILLINGEWIFRFPKYDHVLEKFRIETALLHGLQGRLPLAIPNPVFVSLEATTISQSFIGYHMILGEPLWRDVFRAINSPQVIEALADQLAQFLLALHSLPTDEITKTPLPVDDTYQIVLAFYGRIRQKLFDFMRLDARRQVAEHFESFLADRNNFSYRPVLKHSDFGTSNILFDKERQQITGIIDFSSSRLGDPAYDFAGLLSSYGEAFVHRCALLYPEVENFFERFRFYRGTFALEEALFGVENDDSCAFNAGIAQYI